MRTASILCFLVFGVPCVVHAHHLDCEAEPELVRVAQTSLERQHLPRGQEVQDVLAQVGSDLPNVEIVRAHRSERSGLNQWFREWRAKVRGKAVCGVARALGRSVIVVGDRMATLRPEGKAGRFTVSLQPGVKAAYGFALFRNGTVRHSPILGGKLAFEDSKDVLSVQLVGQTVDGPLPIAQWEKKARFVVSSTNEVDAYAWHQRLFRTLHDAGGLKQPARRNQRLEAAAQRYGNTICDGGRVSHVSSGSSALQRVSEQGLVARDVGEVLVKAPTVSAALAALLRSASHRLVLLDKRMTDVGFGIHRTQNQVCVVGLFASWPRPVSIGAVSTGTGYPLTRSQ